MRRLLLLILCLCSIWTAQGQVAYDWRYWFDQSPTYEQGSSEGTLHLNVDVSGLSKSLHQIHIQVRDTAGMFSEPVSKYFFVPDDGHGSSKLHYWFDQNNAALRVVDLGNGMFDLDVSHLNTGFHTLHFIATDKYGATSEPMHRGFIRATDVDALKWRYWFDDELDNSVVMPPTTTSLMIDVDSLTDGLHYIHFQAMNDHFSEAKTQMFIKVPKTMNLDEMYCLLLIDNTLYSKETINIKNGGMATLNLDVKDLSQGLHKLDVMVMTPSGALSTAYNSYFVRGFLSDDLGTLRCLYAFDDETEVHETTYSEGMSHLNIDVAHLEDGPHTVRWMLADREGAYVSDKRSWFIKLPLGGNAVAKYSYWLNDADSMKHETVLLEPKNPYDLIALLPVETMPLRSSCFHFENKDNQPMLYAKNDIHFTFTDKFGRETNISKQYVDYSISQEVTDIADLQSTQTFARPEENGITWFKFEAAPGDTIGFRSSQATTIQVFAPSGKEILSTMGDKSVQYTGAHTWETGTYYVAVHDVTGTKSNVTLDYMHMDKYAVVSQDVYVVGNGGCSTITFQGNGFNELESVTLTHGAVVLNSIEIEHASDASTSVMFDFTGVEIGKYDAVFHFTEEDKRLANNIIVEKAKEIEIRGTVTFASTYLRSTYNTYTVNLTNMGNMTAYELPVAVYIFTPNISDLQGVKIVGHSMEQQYRKDIPQLFTPKFEESISVSKQTSGDMCFFTTRENDEYVPGFSSIHKTVMSVSIGPNTTESYNISVKATSTAYVYVWWPSGWDCLAFEPGQVSKSKMRSSASDGICAIANERARQCEENAKLESVGIKAVFDLDCSNVKPSKLCPNSGGGSSSPVTSFDPNDIYGYVAESGSRYVGEDVVTLPYRIEFENDTTFATAAAHTVVIKDTLDAKVFDLSSYQPTSIKIGDKDVLLKGDKEFVTTIDMRPAINAIAQVEGKFDEKKGIATWTFTSLDPMTMETTDDVMQGFLPVNYDGSGIGEVAFNINRKAGLADGTEIKNRASIVFDVNDPILTPTWTNIIDAVAPSSHVKDLEFMNDTIVRVHFDGEDNRSGIWKYALYVQYGENASWNQVAEVDTTCFDFRYYEDIDYGFCVMATDSAGNVEKKVILREFSFRNGEAEEMTDAIAAPVVPTSPAIYRAYDLNGRLVQDENQKGIIIKNRKKIAVK